MHRSLLPYFFVTVSNQCLCAELLCLSIVWLFVLISVTKNLYSVRLYLKMINLIRETSLSVYWSYFLFSLSFSPSVTNIIWGLGLFCLFCKNFSFPTRICTELFHKMLGQVKNITLSKNQMYSISLERNTQLEETLL